MGEGSDVAAEGKSAITRLKSSDIGLGLVRQEWSLTDSQSLDLKRDILSQGSIRAHKIATCMLVAGARIGPSGTSN